MRNCSRKVLGVITSLLLAGCSNSGGGGVGGGTEPKSKDEAIAKLSPAHKQSFETWQKQVVKACDAAQAFGLNTDGRTLDLGVDGAALIKKNGGSLVFTENENLAVLTSYRGQSGVGTSKVDSMASVNGETSYRIAAETKREGSRCELYLYGQKVFETTILENFTVGAERNATRPSKPLTGRPVVKALAASGLGEVRQFDLSGLLAEEFKPSSEAIGLVARKLGIHEDEAKEFFQLDDTSSIDAAVRLGQEPSAVWAHQSDGTLVADAKVLRNIFEAPVAVVPLELRLALPQLSFQETRNSADAGNLKLLVTLAVGNREAIFSYSTQKIQIEGIIPFGQPEAVTCASRRAIAYSAAGAPTKVILPSVSFMLSPCRTLHNEVEKASYEAGLMKSLIPQLFAGVEPSRSVQYNGWDEVLRRLALEAYDRGQNLRAELDPASRTRLVPVVSNHFDAIKAELTRSANAATLKPAALDMALGWAFAGLEVQPQKLREIMQAVEHTIDPFKRSSESLLGELGRDPNGADDLLAFARSIDAAYKAEAMKALGLSQELGYVEFERELFNRVIQRKVSGQELKEWSGNFSTVKGAISAYANLGPVKADLVGTSLKWLRSGDATAQTLDPVYAALSNSIAPFENSTKDLVRALGSSLKANQEALDFARGLTPEYKQLATAIRDNSKAAARESWGQVFFDSILQKRPSLEQLRVWNEMWNAALAFTQREKARTAGEFGSTNDWRLTNVIDTAVNETWSNAEFAAFEVIAEVARAKNACERHKGMSSLADCAGLDRFSKKKGHFFDPAFGGRYVTLSRDFVSYLAQMSGFDWTSLKWALVNEFFGTWEPIWSKCPVAVLDQKASTLKGQVNAIVRERDQFAKWKLESAIKDTLKNCE